MKDVLATKAKIKKEFPEFDFPDRYAENPCGDGGSTRGFHEGNTCHGGGSDGGDDVHVEIAPGHVIQVTKAQADQMIGNPHLPHARIVTPGKPAAPKAEVPRPAPAPPKAPAADHPEQIVNAFKAADKKNGGTNFVKLLHLRQALPHLSREEFDSALRKLRLSGGYTLESHEGLHGGLTPEEKEASVHEQGSRLVYMQKRD